MRGECMKYNIIYADPPWQYKVFHKSDAAHGAAESHYRTMTLDEIKALPVQDLAAENCALFLWVTPPLIVEATKPVMDAWGFRYINKAFTWVKLNKNGTPFVSLGHYTRGNTEDCFLGLRGRMVRKSASVQQLIMAPRGEHSAKPPETRDRIVQLFGDLPRIELFARTKTPGWDVWGNEVESDMKWWAGNESNSHR